ncbi:hypothetical protein BC829DRAFT_87372 [Chytridium lagenaria]|nr:hypothetical protein BC829DRAFT_87372 [Chytridium lagenaria]
MSSRREGRHPSSRPSHLPTPSQHPLSHLPQHQQDHLNIPPQDPQRNSDSSFLTLSLPSDIQDFFLGDNPTYDEPLLLHGGFGVSAKKERGVGKTKIEVPSVKVNPDDPSMKRNRKQEMERLGNESSRRSIARSEDTLFRPSLSQESRPSRAMDVPPPPQIPLKDPLERTGIPMHSASDPLSRRRVDDTLWKQRVDDAHVVKHAASDSFLMVGENPSMDRGTGSLGSRLARRSNMSLSIDTRSPNDIRRSKSPLEKVEGGDAVEKTEVPSQNMNEEPPMEMQKSKGLSENEPTVMNVTDFAELKARRLQGVGLQRSLTNQVIGMPNVGESGTPNTLQGILEKRTQATRRPSNKGNVHFRTPSMEGQTKSNWFGVGRGNTNTTITSDSQFMALQNSTTAKEDVLSPTTSVRTMVDFPRDLAMGDLEECLFIEREAYGEDPDAFYARVMKEDKRKEDDEDGGVGGVVLTRRFKRALVHFLYVEDLELFDEVAAFKEMYPEVDKMEAHEHLLDADIVMPWENRLR